MNMVTETTLREIVKRDERYAFLAYVFVFEALNFTLKKIKERRHITGQELLEGIRDYAWNQFGSLAKMVFAQWGVAKTEDFGEIVFNLVETGLMGRTETDSREDFKDGYDFDAAFSFEQFFKRGASGRRKK